MEYDGDRVSHLECFDTFLTKIYRRKGFRAIAHVPFNDEYAPIGWSYEEMEKFHQGRPPILIMVPKEHMKHPTDDQYDFSNETNYEGNNIYDIIKRSKGS